MMLNVCFKGVFRTIRNNYDEAFQKIANSCKPVTIFAKKIHHRSLIGS